MDVDGSFVSKAFVSGAFEPGILDLAWRDFQEILQVLKGQKYL